MWLHYRGGGTVTAPDPYTRTDGSFIVVHVIALDSGHIFRSALRVN